mgnify:CR=1 FL=1
MVVLHLLDADDAGLIAALRGEGLPDAGDGRYFTAHEHGDLVGYVGLEISGPDALLRSAVIFIRARRRGLGRAMIERLLALASEYGIERVWLLTTSAPGFFAKLGFDHVERTTAPPAIAASEEFSDLCPSTAVCLVRALPAAAFAHQQAV